MTREEEIYNAIIDLSIGDYNEDDPLDCDEYDGSDLQDAFMKGAKWADENPKCSWISVKDDLPCNHEELLHPLYANFTKDILVMYENKYISLEKMIKDDKSNWKFVGNVFYWMPIPESPKEWEIKL